jgi:hypothetical protein
MPFATSILAGGYSQRFARLSLSGENHTAFHFGRLEYEPRGRSQCVLKLETTRQESAGSSYTMIPDQLHQLVDLDQIVDVTVSLFVQGHFYQDTVTLYVPGDVDDFPIAPRISYTPGTMTRIARLANEALA